jgi:hypothetical protein
MDDPRVFAIMLTVLLAAAAAAPITAWLFGRQQVNAMALRRGWHNLAQRTGLTFESGQSPANARVVGTYRGRALRLALAPAPLGTRLEVAMHCATCGQLAIAERSWRAQLQAALRGSRTQRGTEQARFEQRFELLAEPATLGAPLAHSTSLQHKLLLAHPALAVRAQGDSVLVTEPGVVADPEYLMLLLDLASDVARLVEAGSPRPEPAG